LVIKIVYYNYAATTATFAILQDFINKSETKVYDASLVHPTLAARLLFYYSGIIKLQPLRHSSETKRLIHHPILTMIVRKFSLQNYNLFVVLLIVVFVLWIIPVYFLDR